MAHTIDLQCRGRLLGDKSADRDSVVLIERFNTVSIFFNCERTVPYL